MYKSLQAGRAIAAISVVLFHLGGAISADKYFGIKAFAIPFSFGDAGVEFFFVLSGFIILSAHRHDIFKPHKLASYIRKRLIRIYPTYWIVFLSVFFLALAFSALRNSVPHDLLTVLKSLLLVPQDSNVIGGPGAPVILVAWTLQFEMFFYCFFALLILNKWVSIIAGLTLLYIYINYFGVSSLSFPISFLSQDYILLFAMGMAVSLICTSRKAIINWPGFYVVIGALIFSIVALDNILQIGMLTRSETLLYGLASSFIIFGLVQSEDKGRIFGGGGHSWIQILGDSSYALYLIHYPLISILCKLFLIIGLDKIGIMGAVVSYVTIFCACLISAVVFHMWLEKPIASYFKNLNIEPQKSLR